MCVQHFVTICISIRLLFSVGLDLIGLIFSLLILIFINHVCIVFILCSVSLILCAVLYAMLCSSISLFCLMYIIMYHTVKTNLQLK
jgi:hypothetical protein